MWIQDQFDLPIVKHAADPLYSLKEILKQLCLKKPPSERGKSKPRVQINGLPAIHPKRAIRFDRFKNLTDPNKK